MLILLGFVSLSCGARDPSPAATAIVPASSPPAPAAAETPTASTEANSPQIEDYPQVFIGMSPILLDFGGCDQTIWTVDYDPNEGQVLNFWEAHPEIPPPEGLTYNTNDGLGLLNYCSHPGFPLTFVMKEGQVVEVLPDEGVINIQILKGVGAGFTLTLQQVDVDINPRKQGVQSLSEGQIVKDGDVIAYSNPAGRAPGRGPSTAIGILSADGYHPDQEMMLIGPDGQPNILYIP